MLSPIYRCREEGGRRIFFAIKIVITEDGNLFNDIRKRFSFSAKKKVLFRIILIDIFI